MTVIKETALLLPPTSCLSELAAQLRDAPAGATIDLGDFVVSGALPDSMGDVLSITQPGLTLRNGTLRLTGRQSVAVTAVGVALEDVDVIVANASADGGSQGRLSVIGSGCGLELRGCTVTASMLKPDNLLLCADGGARLVLADCRVASTSGGTACTVAGASKLTAIRSTFQGCITLLKVSAGSVAELVSSTFSGSSDAGGGAVCVADDGSGLTALDCQWSANAGDGLSVQSGAHATLKGSSLCGSGEGGVEVIGMGSSLTADDTRFCDNMEYGGRVRDGARAVLQRCEFSGTLRGNGLYVIGYGSTAAAAECRVVENAGHGVLLTQGASAELSQCQVNATEGSGCAGLSVSDRGTSAVARGCCFGDDASRLDVVPGLSVTGGGHALLHRCCLKGDGAEAVVEEGSRLQLVLCTGDEFTADGGGQLVQ